MSESNSLSSNPISICNVGGSACDLSIVPDDVGVVHLEPGERWTVRHSRTENDSGSLNEIVQKISFCCGGDDKCAGACDCQCHSLIAERDRLRAALERAHAVIRKCVTAGVLRHDLNQFLADEAEYLGPPDETTAEDLDKSEHGGLGLSEKQHAEIADILKGNK